MTTTLQAHGGGAQPASIDTSGKVTGGVALRVYGFDSAEAAQAAGYVCEGGPAMSVALITDAQIAAGDWKVEGDPAALVVYTAPDGMPVEGGYAVPIYPVNGWGSAPAPSDPIGDGLRADCAAYWTFNDTQWLDSAHDSDLTPNNGPTVSSGKIGNAVSLDSTQTLTVNSNANLKMSGTFTLAGWFKVDAAANTAVNHMIVGKLGNSFGDYFIDLELPYDNQWEPTLEIADGNDSGGISPTVHNIGVNEWHFVVAWYDSSDNSISILLDNDLNSFNSAVINKTPLPTDDPFYFADGTGWGEPNFHGLLDEWGLWKRVLTSDEKDYLWNRRAGRTLYP